MCIGIPMEVVTVAPGHALCVGRGGQRLVRTALIDPVAVGDWVLVFLDSAQEHITPERAREINGTLDLLAAVFGEDSGKPFAGEAVSAPAGVAFDLPSRMSREQLVALSGGSTATPC